MGTVNIRIFSYFLLLFVVTGKTGYGQMDDFAWFDFPMADNSDNGKLTGTKYNYAFRGNLNYFYHSDWYAGTIYTTDGDVHSGYSLRYDAFNDELMAVNVRVKGLFVVDKSLVKSFTVEVPGWGVQVFRKLELKEFGQKERFFEVLYEGKIALLSYTTITEHKTSAYRNKTGELDDREYKLEKQYFLLKPDLSLRSISPGRKSMLNLFPERKKEIRQLLRRNRIDDYSLNGIPGIIALLDRENYFLPDNSYLK
jgi:hypothetical protein